MAYFTKQYQLEDRLLEGVSIKEGGLYRYLKSKLKHFDSTIIENLPRRKICKDLSIGPNTFHELTETLIKMGLLEVLYVNPDNPSLGVVYRLLIDDRLAEQHVDNSQDELPKNETRGTGENHDPESSFSNIMLQEHKGDASYKKAVKKLNKLGIYPTCYAHIINKPQGLRFIKQILKRYPNASGPVIRIKIEDKANLNKFKVQDLFYQEASKIPTGSRLMHTKLGEVGEWTWTGKIGKLQLDNKLIIIDSLGALRSLTEPEWKVTLPRLITQRIAGKNELNIKQYPDWAK